MMTGLDPGQVRSAATILDSQALLLEAAVDTARTALAIGDLTSPVLTRLTSRSEDLRTIAIELRSRAEQIENIPAGLAPHITELALRTLVSRGLESICTIAELDHKIDNWHGSDNDSILDSLIKQRSDLIETVRIASQDEVKELARAAMDEIMAILGVAEGEARTILENVAWPYLLAEQPYLYSSVGRQIQASTGIEDPTLETIIQAMREGFGLNHTWVAGSAESAYTDPSTLSEPNFVRHLTLLALQEHHFRGANAGAPTNAAYVESLWAYQDVSAQIREFEAAHFGVGHTKGFAIGIHGMLDLLGLIPVLGEPADALNAGIYIVEGDLSNAALSAAGMVPIAGWSATVLKRAGQLAKQLGGKVVKVWRATDGTVINIIELADGSVVGVIETANGTRIHRATDAIGESVDELDNAASEARRLAAASNDARRHDLGFDNAVNKLRPSEIPVAFEVETTLGVTLRRVGPGEVGDWVDQAGLTYDAVGGPPVRFFESQWANMRRQIIRHGEEYDVVPVNLAGLTAEQQQRVIDFTNSLDIGEFIFVGRTS